MTDQEMLKEAREWLGFITKIEAGMNEHVKEQRMKVLAWLIGQAERVQELERQLKVSNSVHADDRKLLNRRTKQNKRYREALGFYADEDNYRVTWDDDYEPILRDGGEKARKALEGEK